MTPPDPRYAGVGALALLVVCLILVAGFTGIYRQPFAPDTYELTARFTNAQQLRTGADVRIAGVAVGKVKELHAVDGSRATEVVMSVKRSAPTLYRDATATLSWRLLLGGSFIVNLDPGHPASGRAARDFIPSARTANQVELEDLLGIDRGAAREGIATMPGELAEAFANPAQPKRTLTTLADVAPDIATGVAAARGRDDGDLRRLVANTSRAVRALDTPTSDFALLVSSAARAVQTTARRRTDIVTAIQATPATARRLTTTLTRLQRTLDVADPVLAQLTEVAPPVRPTLATLRPTLDRATTLLRDARPLLAATRPGVRSLARASHTGAPVLDEAKPGLELLADRILPDLAKVSPESKRPTYQMIGPSIASIGNGAMGGYDAQTHFFRFPVTVGEGVLDDAPCRTLLTDPAAKALVTCRELGDLLETYFNYDPFKTPGTQPPSASRTKAKP